VLDGRLRLTRERVRKSEEIAGIHTPRVSGEDAFAKRFRALQLTSRKRQLRPSQRIVNRS